MRKITLAISALAFSCSVFAQKSNMSIVKDALYDPTPKAMTKATAAIQAALQHAETKDVAETHYYAGKVFKFNFDFAKNESDSQAKITNIMSAVDEYNIAYNLDQQPNEKGKVKPKFANPIKKELNVLSNELINLGLTLYQEENYVGATNVWRKFIDLPNNPAMSDMAKDSTYNDIYYYAINAASISDETKPQAIAMMEEFKTSGYKDAPKIFNWLSDLYKEKGDTASAVRTLKDGITLYPSNEEMMAKLINHYTSTGKTDEAISYLDNAIKQNPKNDQYYVVKGNMLCDQKKYDEALATFNAILTNVSSDNAAAYSGIGQTYVLKGEDLVKQSNDIPYNSKNKAKIDNLSKQAKAEYQKAKEPLEKAYSIDPKNRINLNFLRAVYTKLEMNQQADKIKKEIDAL